ncbi:hypothetical protein BGW36DRAFT_390430 [Talaromyces proteolyticus]|uniref:Uncharacterized protein n=1 Tax=Talaromyces proteolyticus TaxID=1131652 RepID=A0AAD4PVF6_9EURO|nr:uncharacterized protein BGW36DRAFT_390430 [Talaromyces proteolyticus]KAH8690238.1 hypothetical protein BGW36DRAFT_390430 [Talaromyces proteolyticus]
MDIVHGKNAEFVPPPLKHRGDGLAFKDLFRGQNGTPENYYLSVARQGDFYSPRHKHNFDQFRFALRNEVSISPDMLLREGELSYHPEGVQYGPQHDDGGKRDVLVLQFGGASGQGYLSFDQLAAAQAALKETGRFEGGKYYSNDGTADDGKDGYEALWEHCNGRPLVYPTPRFHDPILIKPNAFAWKPYTRTPGHNVLYKSLGVFTERETRVQMIRVESDGQWELRAENAIQLLYVLRGEGSVISVNAGSPQRMQVESALRLTPDSDSHKISTTSEIEILHFILPMLSSGLE